jgi:hypothetical protein
MVVPWDFAIDENHAKILLRAKISRRFMPRRHFETSSIYDYQSVRAIMRHARTEGLAKVRFWEDLMAVDFCLK